MASKPTGTKYNSGPGWPSFWQPVAAKSVAEVSDRSHESAIRELRCAGFQAGVRALMLRQSFWITATAYAWLAASAAAETPPATPPAATSPEAVLLVTDLVAGIGDEAFPGMIAIVHYTGWLHDPNAADLRGKEFDSSRKRGQPFSFPLGGGHVIRGWEQGVPGMKVGGLRRLVIPPELAYGNRDIGNGLIPPGSTLTFEIELLAVETVTFHPQQ